MHVLRRLQSKLPDWLRVLIYPPPANTWYQSMQFERTGAGALQFSLYPSRNENKVRVRVTHFNFKDVNVRFTLQKNSDATSAFETLYAVFRNQVEVQMSPDNKEMDNRLSGTWLSMYLIRANEKVEISNQKLMYKLSDFESFVDSKMGQYPKKKEKGRGKGVYLEEKVD